MGSDATAQQDSITVRRKNAAKVITTSGDLPLMAASFQRHLRAENKAPRTLAVYGDAVRNLTDFLAANGMPLNVADVSREHVEEFIADILTRSKPSTASVRFRALQQFFKWA